MTKNKDKSFINKFLISIKDFEKYPELAIRSWKEVIIYITILILIFTAITSIAYTFTISKQIYDTPEEEFNEIVKEYNIEGVSKNDLLEYFDGTDSIIMYIEIYLVIFICIFIVNIINTIFNVIILSILGYFATIFMKMRIRANAMFKIAIHSLTLPILLNIIVIYIETFTKFHIKYFDFMYLIIAYIYILAAISIIRMDIIKNKQELINIMEEQKKVKEELERKEEEEKTKKKEKKQEKQENKEDKEEKEENKDEPQSEGT